MCFPVAAGHPTDILNLHASGDRRRRGDAVGDFGSDAASLAEFDSGVQSAGSRGRLSASGSSHMTIREERNLHYTFFDRRQRRDCATVITANEPWPIKPLFAQTGGGMPFAAHEWLVKRSLRLQRFTARSRGLHGLGNEVSLRIKMFRSPRTD